VAASVGAAQPTPLTPPPPFLLSLLPPPSPASPHPSIVSPCAKAPDLAVGTLIRASEGQIRWLVDPIHAHSCGGRGRSPVAPCLRRCISSCGARKGCSPCFAAHANELPNAGFVRAGSGMAPSATPILEGGGASLHHQAGSSAAPHITGPRRGCFITQSGSAGTLRGFVAPCLLPVGLLASSGLPTSGRRAVLGCRSTGLWSWPC
jgi:hypothetical protein